MGTFPTGLYYEPFQNLLFALRILLDDGQT